MTRAEKNGKKSSIFCEQLDLQKLGMKEQEREVGKKKGQTRNGDMRGLSAAVGLIAFVSLEATEV